MVRKQVEALEHDADVLANLAQRATIVGQRLPVEVDRAAVDLLETVDAAEQRRLAEPERPMTATTSPVSTSSETSSSTTWSPKRLRTLRNARSGIKARTRESVVPPRAARS
jgi:hypothetical protein